MAVTDELIQKFLNDACSYEEAEEVSLYLKANPDAMAKYLDSEDWEQEGWEKQLPENFWETSWQEIEEKKQAAKRIFTLRVIAAAASVIIALFAGGYFWINTQETGTVTAPVYTYQTVTNTSTRDTSFLLQDQSVVLLKPGSSVSFDVPFQQNRRDVHLLGQGFFKVAKDPTKPFTVYSNELSTTALGTEFWVTSAVDGNTIEVKLIEGKVVVKPRGQSDNAGRNYYLVPGEVLRYDRKQMTAIVNTLSKDSLLASKTAVPTAQKKTTMANTGGKQPLATVLDQLSQMHRVTILYSAADMRSRYFIGKLDKAEPLDKTLKTICKLHGLTLENPSPGKYTIGR